MSKLLRISAWLLLVTLVVWVAVIAYWQISGIRPEVRDLVLYLGVLPLGTFAALALFKRGLDHAGRKAGQATEEATAATPDRSGETEPAKAPPAPRVGILATALRVPAGDDPAGVLAALATPASPELHDKLKDGNGFPVFAAWAKDADTELVEQVFESFGTGEPAPRDEQARGLALLLPVAQDLIAEAAMLWPVPEPPAPSFDRRSAPPQPELRIGVFLPADWPESLAPPLREWLSSEARMAGIPGEQVVIDVLPTTTPDEVWGRIDTLARLAYRPEAPVTHLLLACHSQVGERGIRQLEHAGGLLSSKQPEGVVPGEGAAGLLLVAENAQQQIAPVPRAVLRAQARARKGVSWQPRAAITQVSDLLREALDAAPDLAIDDIKAIVSDADLRRSRASVAAGVVAQSLPALDPEADCVHCGAGCGHLGIAAPLVLLAMSAAKTEATSAPTLLLALAEGDQRALALVLPPDAPSSEAAATPSSPSQAS